MFAVRTIAAAIIAAALVAGPAVAVAAADSPWNGPAPVPADDTSRMVE